MEEVITIRSGMAVSVDETKKIVTLNGFNLKMEAKKKRVYDIGYNDIKAYVRGDLVEYLDEGYSVVLDYKQIKLLLILNNQ